MRWISRDDLRRGELAATGLAASDYDETRCIRLGDDRRSEFKWVQHTALLIVICTNVNLRCPSSLPSSVTTHAKPQKH